MSVSVCVSSSVADNKLLCVCRSSRRRGVARLSRANCASTTLTRLTTMQRCVRPGRCVCGRRGGGVTSSSSPSLTPAGGPVCRGICWVRCQMTPCRRSACIETIRNARRNAPVSVGWSASGQPVTLRATRTAAAAAASGVHIQCALAPLPGKYVTFCT